MKTFTPPPVRTISPDSFQPDQHWYPKALNAQIHPLVAYFMNLSRDKILSRYCHLNPQVDADRLSELMAYKPKYLLHAGADLFHVTDSLGNRKMVVIETNSCPSGQKSMPLLDERQEEGGYRTYMEKTFYPAFKARRIKVKGGLAVLYDKNNMEASGYASAMANVFGEEVHFVPFFQQDDHPPARFVDQILEVRTPSGEWVAIRAAFRYVTQQPWGRLPVFCKTMILNPIIACLAGGRNKMMAAKAYDFMNAEIAEAGLRIFIPETIWDVRKNEVPLWVKKMGGHAVVKVPYANAGQGVFTIVSEEELEGFMQLDFPYDMFIVQSLIGNYQWSSHTQEGRYYHVGTMPDRHKRTYVADIRMMVASQDEGLRPIAIYARRARGHLTAGLPEKSASWNMLGTNLSIKLEDGTFTSDSSRLMMMDRRDFNKLGVSVDDLIEAYFQTIFSAIAIDKMAQMLINPKGRLKPRLFRSLNDDAALVKEIMLEGTPKIS